MIELEVIEKEDWAVRFKIVRQDEILFDDFDFENVQIRSCKYPHVSFLCENSLIRFYVRGEYKTCNNSVLSVPSCVYKRIKKAVKAYNKMRAEKNSVENSKRNLCKKLKDLLPGIDAMIGFQAEYFIVSYGSMVSIYNQKPSIVGDAEFWSPVIGSEFTSNYALSVGLFAKYNIPWRESLISREEILNSQRKKYLKMWDNTTLSEKKEN